MQLAKKAGISQAVISEYENDIVTEHRAHILMKLASALETTPEYLITGKGDPDIFKISQTDKELIQLIDTLSPEAKVALLLAARAMVKA